MVLAKERERECLALRKAGATYDQIADRVGITREGARAAVIRALAALSEVCTEEAKEVRQLELERLDAMLLGLWQRASKGEVAAIDRVLRIQERRSRLLGLDAVPQHGITNSEGKVDTVDFIPAVVTVAAE